MSAPGPTSEAHPSLSDFSGAVVLVGAGKMGGALLEGWLKLGLDPRHVTVLEPQPSAQIAALAGRGLRLNPDPRTLPSAAALVIALKPQIAAQAVPALAPLVVPATVVVSIMAGRTLAFLANALDRPCALIRAMPNTPAAIGRGITVAVSRDAGADQRQLAHRLLAATGAVEWIDDEALMDAVTAVSGSGPAYVFLLAEALAQAGVAAGLAPNWRKNSRAKPSPAPANCCTVRRSTLPRCAKTSPRPAAPPPRRSRS